MNAYRPSNGALVTLDGGIWSAVGRPTVRVTITADARLLYEFVQVADRNPSNVATLGLGNPPLVCKLT